MDSKTLEKHNRRAKALHESRERTQRERRERNADQDAYVKECDEQITAALDQIEAAKGEPLYINTTGMHDYVRKFLKMHFNTNDRNVLIQFN
jgi:adenosylmethionine-8-amino-7-oxononanoate aminotransferase